MRWSVAVAVWACVASCDRNQSPRADEKPGHGAAPADVVANYRAAFDDLSATVAAASGKVAARRAGQAVQTPVNVGAPVWRGDSIVTGPNSEARLRWPAGGAVELSPQSELAFAAGADLVVDLRSGAARVSLAQGGVATRSLVAGSGRLDVSPTGDGGGAVLQIAAADGGALTIVVERGALAANLGDQTAQLEAGQGVSIDRAAEPPTLSKPWALAAAPTLVAPPAGKRVLCAKGRPVTLDWDRPPGAQSFVVSIEPAAGDGEPLTTERSSAPLVTEQAGVYRWSVTSVDERGVRGRTSESRHLFCESSRPSGLLTAPRAGVRLRASKSGTAAVEFAWKPAPSGAPSGRYTLRVASGKSLAVEGASVTTTSDLGATVELAPGRYTWGVFTGETPPRPLFLRPRALVVAPASPGRTGPRAHTGGLWNN